MKYMIQILNKANECHKALYSLCAIINRTLVKDRLIISNRILCFEEYWICY